MKKIYRINSLNKLKLDLPQSLNQRLKKISLVINPKLRKQAIMLMKKRVLLSKKSKNHKLHLKLSLKLKPRLQLQLKRTRMMKE